MSTKTAAGPDGFGPEVEPRPANALDELEDHSIPAFSATVVARDRTEAEEEIGRLLRHATSQADHKDYEAAIDSLMLAYRLMDEVPTEWPIRTYFRLARYLHLSGKYEQAMQWLHQLHETLDAWYDAREALYKTWGWMQGRNKPASVPKAVRKNLRSLIENEIALYARRQRNIEQKLQHAVTGASDDSSPPRSHLRPMCHVVLRRSPSTSGAGSPTSRNPYPTRNRFVTGRFEEATPCRSDPQARF